MQGKAFESWEKQAKEEQMGYAEVNSTLRHTKRYAFRIESIFPEWLSGSHVTPCSCAGRMRHVAVELTEKQRWRPSGSRGEASLTRAQSRAKSRLRPRSVKGRNSTRTVVASCTMRPESRKKGSSRSQVA